jgi:hypothetical protein
MERVPCLNTFFEFSNSASLQGKRVLNNMTTDSIHLQDNTVTNVFTYGI